MIRYFQLAFTCLFCMWSPVIRAQIAPENSFISCHPFSAQANGIQACLVEVLVHHADGTPAVDRQVTLVSDRGSVDQIVPSIASVDPRGRAQFRVTSRTRGTAHLSAICDSQGIKTEIVTNGVVGIYTFDGNSPSGRVRDLSGHGNHGVLHGDPNFAPGHSGEAIVLNGKDQYIEIPDGASLSGLRGNAVECWIRASAEAEAQALAVIGQKSRDHAGDYRLSLQGRKIAYHYRCSQREQKQLEEALSDDAVVLNDTWTHAAGFWEGSDINERVRFHGYVRAYTSGAQFDPVPKAQQVEGIWNCRNEHQPFFIGGDGETSNSFSGMIDNFRIYDRALYDEEMRRNHSGDASITFGLEPPTQLSAETTLPECVLLAWELQDRNVTSVSIYRALTAAVPLTPEHLLMVVPYPRDHFRDYEVDFDQQYHYVVVANSFENQSLPSRTVSAQPVRAEIASRWYRGDGHLHTFTHDIDVEDFDPENTLLEARKSGWDFALITEHNSLGSYFRNEDQGTKDFIVIGNGQEISDGGEHRTGAFLKHFIPTSETQVFEQNRMALEMGGEVGPNHNAYRKSAPNITLFEAVNNQKWFPFDAWDNEYLKQGIHVAAKGGSDAHGRFSVKRGYRWCVWADRLSYRALRESIHAGRTFAVDGDGLECMLKINGAMIGDTVQATPGSQLKIELSANATLGNVSEVKLIRFGEPVQTWNPAEPNWKITMDDVIFDGQPTYYRLEVLSDEKPRRAVTSAIFINSRVMQ